VLASCGTDWAHVQGATAHTRSDTSISVNYGVCWLKNTPMPTPKIVESDTAVRITSEVHSPGGDSKACLTLQTITLAKPIGDRVVVDARTGKTITVAFDG
jgi:hypothetical protein